MNRNDQQFLKSLTELAYCNPFSRRRLDLEQQALGESYCPEDAELWSRTQATQVEERPNVLLICERAETLSAQLVEQLAAGKQLQGQLAEWYDGLVTYVLYYRHMALCEFEQIAAYDAKSRTNRTWQAFWEDYQRFFIGSAQAAHDLASAAHLFACLFQIRRAFRHIFDCILGQSSPAARLREAVWESIFTHDMRRYRRSLYRTLRELPTLVTGPSGTGKELVARAIAMSQYLDFDPERQQFVDDPANAFTPLNLSALSPTLIESELFGHLKGSFTGATSDRVGWLEACRPHGAVFLDEIGELDLTIQVKLLRVLQQRTYCRIGETVERVFVGKIIAATNRDLAVEIEEGRFRHDLYYRLCADRIETPSLYAQLADRPQALEDLVRLLAERIAPGEAESLAAEVLEGIAGNLPKDYDWPGNIRELEQCVRNILVHGKYVPRTPPAEPRDGWLEAAEAGKLTADELLSAYATQLYHRLGTYEAVAQQMALDRRTVKGKIRAE